MAYRDFFRSREDILSFVSRYLVPSFLTVLFDLLVEVVDVDGVRGADVHLGEGGRGVLSWN